ncbi:MAG: hydroxysqualene dehydroxylase HpnE [Pirellulales bacterium]
MTAGASLAIIGGGLAGLAAAAALAGRGLRVELFEARKKLGGRAGSFRDPATGEAVDHCQHVSMGCCTNLADFCRRTGIDDLFQRHDKLHFFGPDGSRYDFASSAWLPAPLHLGPALMGLGYLTRGERLSIGRAMLRLARLPDRDTAADPTIGQWLVEQGQSARACRDFWGVVLVSALGETLERASLRYARQVFVDGFMSHRDGWKIEVPTAPLGVVYGARLEQWLASQDVKLHVGRGVEELQGSAGGIREVRLADGEKLAFDAVILAVPWRRVRHVLSPPLLAALPELAHAEQIEAAPITGVHMWFDRPMTDLPHAVLVGKLSQWMFNRGDKDDTAGHYYQVVVSASRDLAGQNRESIVAQVHDDLASLWPAVRQARLLQSRVVTEQQAVFSVRPGMDAWRPRQQSSIANLFLAGDWTNTGWPATMEGAVRSGYLAAEALLAARQTPQPIVVPSLPRGRLARLLLGAT